MTTWDFPDSPVNGETYEFMGLTWQYNSTTDMWHPAAGRGPNVVQQYFNTTGTYTPAAGMRYAQYVRVDGSGGYTSEIKTAAQVGGGETITISGDEVYITEFLGEVFGSAAGVPIGDIRVTLDAVPDDNCAELDGSTITGGATLFPIIAARYPWMVSGSDIILPDFRGRFLRSWAHGSSNDPNRGTRTARAGDSQTGDYVGTYQDDAYAQHSHNINLYSRSIYTVTGSGGNAATTVPTGSELSSENSGGNETRPININVLYQIRLL